MTEIDLKRYVDDNERRYKAAFMALLKDYEYDLSDFCGRTYCQTSCPYRKTRRSVFSTCKLGFLGEDETPVEDYDDTPEETFDTCAEAIFNWYMENAND